MDIMESTVPTLAAHVAQYAGNYYGAGYFGNGMTTDQMMGMMMDLGEKLGDADFLLDLYSLEAITTDYGQVGSPVVIDLNGDGVCTIGLWESNISFDISGDGTEDHTGWISAEDAFLVIDRNQNGSIDGVNEMFGGLARGDGYRELEHFDSNHDGVVSTEDARFEKLLLWRDADTDGHTDAGELISMAQAGVSQISLDYVSQDIYDHGNIIGEVSVALVGGVPAQAADVYLAYGT